MVVGKALGLIVVVVDVKKPDQKAEEGIVDDSFSFIFRGIEQHPKWRN